MGRCEPEISFLLLSTGHSELFSSRRKKNIDPFRAFTLTSQEINFAAILRFFLCDPLSLPFSLFCFVLGDQIGLIFAHWVTHYFGYFY
jgi:hypothetical protein